jgi:hypothetical protein
MPISAAQTPLTCPPVIAGTAAGAGSTLPGAPPATGAASAAPVTPPSSAWPARIRPRFCRAVDRLLRDASPRFLVDHCRRSFQLAMLIAAAQQAEIDVEVVYAGVMLHDLGLTSRYHSPAVRFEVVSANAARAFVRRHGLSAQRAEKVWDAAALHGTGGIADAKSPETAVASAAIGADVTGLGLRQFDQGVIREIMQSRPGFAEPFIQAVVTDLQDKPQVASSTWMTTIAQDHIPGFHQNSIGQLALANPYEQPHG